MRLSPEQLPESLKKGLAGAYLVSGEEPLLIGEAADAIRGAARAAGYADRQVFFIERGFDWDELRSATQSLSLFSDRRVFELRLPTGKPDKGAAVLAALATDPPPDSITLVLTDKLDKKALDAPWIQAFQQKGVWIPVKPVSAAELPAWIAGRARREGLELEPAAAQLIADRVEGNLLAAKQELEKLSLLCAGAKADLDFVMRSVGDSARYNVYQLAEAASGGDAPRALHILSGLRGEGVEPTLILWALVRELRGLWQARERNRLRSNERGSAWNLASPPSPRALARAGTLPLGALLIQAGDADRILKGLQSGDPWTAITGLVAGLAGALHQGLVSGRVAR
jgi:DNA polymerase-3 subunit delta